MTRETKIGLLVGLGFIVVFAVLLSHTGSVPPVGDGMPTASRDGGLQDTLVGRALPRSDFQSRVSTPIKEVSGGVAAAPASPGTGLVSRGSEQGRGPVSPLSHGLPRPEALGPSPTEWTAMEARGPIDGHRVGLAPLSATEPVTTVERRVAPALPAQPIEIDRPEPTVPAAPPRMSPSPDVKPERGPSSPPTREAEPREYLVQKGETLGEIAKRHYGTANMRAVEFLATSNKMKDVHTVREGQRLAIPALPPELAAIVEPAPSFDARRLTGDARTVSSEELRVLPSAGSEGRRAPALVRRDAGESAVKAAERPLVPEPTGARTY